MKFAWVGGAAFVDLKFNGKCTWGYCGGGPVFEDVPLTHLDNAISSLLGWDHPVARRVTEYVKALEAR